MLMAFWRRKEKYLLQEWYLSTAPSPWRWGAASFSEKLMPLWIRRKKFSPEMLVLFFFYRIIALKTETAATSKDRIFHIKRCCVTTQQTAILIVSPVAHWQTLKLTSNCRGIQPVSDSDNAPIWHRPCKLFHASLSSAVRGRVCQDVSVRWGRSCMVSPTSWLERTNEGRYPPPPHTCWFGFACNAAQCNYHIFHTRNFCNGKAKFVFALTMKI